MISVLITGSLGLRFVKQWDCIIKWFPFLIPYMNLQLVCFLPAFLCNIPFFSYYWSRMMGQSALKKCPSGEMSYSATNTSNQKVRLFFHFVENVFCKCLCRKKLKVTKTSSSMQLFQCRSYEVLFGRLVEPKSSLKLNPSIFLVNTWSFFKWQPLHS